ncbi:hypothetical protein TIFTF001_021687, partial [Ficus carica]
NLVVLVPLLLRLEGLQPIRVNTRLLPNLRPHCHRQLLLPRLFCPNTCP